MAFPEFDGLFKWMVGILVTILAWCLKQMYTEHRALETMVNRMRVEMVTKAELQELRKEIKNDISEGFERLEKRLDRMKGD